MASILATSIDLTKIPKDKIPEELTYEECVEISEKAPAKKRRFTKK